MYFLRVLDCEIDLRSHRIFHQAMLAVYV